MSSDLDVYLPYLDAIEMSVEQKRDVLISLRSMTQTVLDKHFQHHCVQKDDHLIEEQPLHGNVKAE